MENLCSNNRKRAIEELERGRELANQLRRVIQRSHGGGGDEDDRSKTTPFAQDLAEKVERSFSNTLALLIRRGGGGGDESDDVVSQMLTDYSSCLVPAKSDDSEDTCKSSPAVKERRGSYKRRRTSQTWERDSEAPIDDDGHAWRKYGQKTIMNAKFPRNYYRCTHKYDQGCQATKQVQKIQEEPVLYRTTYYGHHTCNKNLLNPEIILDTGSANSDSSILLSFDNTTLSSKQDLPFFSSPSPSSSLPLASKECKQEIPSSSSDDYLLSHELITTLSSSLESNHKAVIPDVLYDDSVEFDDLFESCL